VPTIELLESPLGPAVSVEGEGPLIDVCDDARAPVGFSCRSADCGTCCVEVLAGGDLLEPAREDEFEVLRRLGATPERRRLACQVAVRAAPGLLRLRWVGPVAPRPAAPRTA
jgi:ferredoxin